MAAKLNVLVLESEQGAAEEAIRDLTEAGHAVLRCHEPGQPAFPCNALADDPACPLRTGVVDVAITVRGRPRTQPSPTEDGVSCALEQHVPLVVAGSTVLHPYEEWAAEVLTQSGDVVAAVERAATAPMPRHGDRAQQALDEFLAFHEIASQPRVEVRRHHGGLQVDVHGTGEIDHSLKGMASVRIIAALREVDPDAKGIDVTFEA